MTPSRRRSNYTEETLIEAVTEIKTGRMSQRRAAIKYGIPQSTIGDRITGRYALKILKRG